MGLHQKKEVADQHPRLRLRLEGPLGGVAEVQIPSARDVARRGLPGHPRRAPPRRQFAPEPGDVLPDLGGAPGPCADGPRYRQEPRRQGRVPPDGGDRAPLRAHDGRPLARPRRRQHGGNVDHRLLRGVHARRDGGEATLAGTPGGGGQAGRQAQHGVRPGAGGLAQVRPVLGCRTAGDPHVARPLLHGRRADARAGGREHHLRHADVRCDLYRCLRAGGRVGAGPRRPAGTHRARTSTSTSTGRVAASWRRSAPPRSSSTFASPG